MTERLAPIDWNLRASGVGVFCGGREVIREGEPQNAHGILDADDVLKAIVRLECVCFMVIARSC